MLVLNLRILCLRLSLCSHVVSHHFCHLFVIIMFLTLRMFAFFFESLTDHFLSLCSHYGSLLQTCVIFFVFLWLFVFFLLVTTFHFLSCVSTCQQSTFHDLLNLHLKVYVSYIIIDVCFLVGFNNYSSKVRLYKYRKRTIMITNLLLFS